MNPRLRVDVLQVMNQLGQVFNRVDVVVRRRGDQPHARRRPAYAGHVVRDLGFRNLAALAGLGALRHLYLQVRGVHQVLGRDAETSGRDLLHPAGPGVAICVRREPFPVLAALAGV